MSIEIFRSQEKLSYYKLVLKSLQKRNLHCLRSSHHYPLDPYLPTPIQPTPTLNPKIDCFWSFLVRHEKIYWPFSLAPARIDQKWFSFSCSFFIFIKQLRFQWIFWIFTYGVTTLDIAVEEEHATVSIGTIGQIDVLILP